MGFDKENSFENKKKTNIKNFGINNYLFWGLLDISQLLENFVFIELLRRGYQVNIGVQGDMEIDFIATKDNDRIYIQVSYILETEKTVQREFAPLLAVKDNYPKYVLSMDEKIWGEDYQGIKRINITGS